VTDELYNELRVIRSRIESIERGQEVLIRADRKAVLAEILPEFQRDPTLGRIYLLVDGVRGQRQIQQEMTASRFAVSEPTVSRKLDKLKELELVVLDDRTAVGNIYRKTQFDRALRLTREVEQLLKAPAKAK
jgi:DNA-binding transcriptional ArsR family regulator